MSHRLSPEAESDLDAIWYYIATNSGSLETADRLIDSLVERFYLLSRHAFFGRPRNELGQGVRSFSIGEYLIFYRIVEEMTDQTVLVLRVLSGSRDLGIVFSR